MSLNYIIENSRFNKVYSRLKEEKRVTVVSKETTNHINYELGLGVEKMKKQFKRLQEAGIIQTYF